MGVDAMKSYRCPLCEAEKKANGLHGHLSLDHKVPWDAAPKLSKDYRQAVDSGDEEAVKAAVQQIRKAAGAAIPGSPEKAAEPNEDPDKAKPFRQRQAELAASMARNRDTEAGDDRPDAGDTPAPVELCQAATEPESPKEGGTEPKRKSWSWLDVAGAAASIGFVGLVVYLQLQEGKAKGPTSFQPMSI